MLGPTESSRRIMWAYLKTIALIVGLLGTYIALVPLIA
jgi:hypothetical protein